LDAQLKKFIDLVKDECEGVAVDVSEPANEDGIWFVDISKDDYVLVVQHSTKFGFGLSSGDIAFDVKSDEIYNDTFTAAARTIALVKSRGLTIPAYSLAAVRDGATQSAIAAKLNISQPTYSGFENSALHKLRIDTLARILGANHAKLLLMVEIEGGKVCRLPFEEELVNSFRHDESADFAKLICSQSLALVATGAYSDFTESQRLFKRVFGTKEVFPRSGNSSSLSNTKKKRLSKNAT
jgi:transcriptional regulator with XRE-family HTH domain